MSTGSVNSDYSLSGIMADISLGPSGSVQMMFAKLQLAQGQICRNQAADYMDQIELIQDEQKKCADMISRARELQQKAPAQASVDELKKVDAYIAEAKELQALAYANKGEEQPEPSGEKESTMMPVEMEDYFKAHDLGYADYGKPRRQNGEEWKEAISSLEGRRKELAQYASSSMPQDMQDFFEKRGLDAGTISSMGKDDWDYALKSLTNFQEQVGNKTQTLMVYLQDFIGQFNAFTQGANTAIASANQTLTNIARGQ